MRSALASSLGILCLFASALQADDNDKIKEIAGTAELLRFVPKRFATLQAVDAARRRVTLRFEDETTPTEWPLTDDAEIKVAGWWGRLDQFPIGDRVWVWLRLDRAKKPTAISMLADELSEQDMHGTAKDTVALEKRRSEQQGLLRKRWTTEGLPGTVMFLHELSGEMELMLDHEAMRWGRSLQRGDSVKIQASPPIEGVVKDVRPWRERTQLRLVVRGNDQADLKLGQRIALQMTPPAGSPETSSLPPDLDRPRTREERLDWFLASIYCTCQVGNDTCTGDFYTLTSCNPNACGMPNAMRRRIAAKIDDGKTDKEIFEELLKEHGPALARPHLLP